MRSLHPAVHRVSSHGVWLRRTLLAAGLAVMTVAITACPSEPSASGGKTAEGAPDDKSQAEAMVKDKWQEGTACVANTAPDCPSEYRGACRTGRADGCSHQACTDAKGNARANLRAVVPETCYKYIQSTDRCLNGPGC
ncbi:hypothetical protein JY651_27780 [Pyxidicoccus parkwayensis]|uniref:Lipoprotein n=1 Tax=Pyxidicoccus parkwayensis TaxID=2813578 RepID=A0ABX7NL32_9BACT|nr:hypothetical protein [Pyxidicoccus parkwaysis]QSQ19146.1 hypothetical protein JY651_27780 [Pyxidicoccus parkwaysis]